MWGWARRWSELGTCETVDGGQVGLAGYDGLALRHTSCELRAAPPPDDWSSASKASKASKSSVAVQQSRDCVSAVEHIYMYASRKPQQAVPLEQPASFARPSLRASDLRPQKRREKRLHLVPSGVLGSGRGQLM